MTFYHDPERQENYLQQLLSHDKKPIGILLGAGAPMAIEDPIKGCCPLIPDIKQMTKDICGKLHSDIKYKAPYNQVCSYFSDTGNTDPNIEEILSYIRLLDKVVGSGIVNGLNSKDIKEMDKEICNTIDVIVKKSLPHKNTPYHKIAAWISSIYRTYSVEIFTTNYDLLMEQALEDLRVSYFDGFSGSRNTFFDTTTIEDDKLPTNWARLWKLHGSINWFVNKEQHLYRSFSPHDNDDLQIIHPSHLKYDESRKMPYLAVIDRLKTFFRKPSALLLTSGYSFRDMHINDTLIQGLLNNPNAIIFGMLFGELSNYPEARKLAEGCPNLSLLAGDSAIIGMQHLPWVQKPTVDNKFKDTCAIRWVEDSSTNMTNAEFTLGDFNNLGLFFSNLIGAQDTGDVK